MFLNPQLIEDAQESANSNTTSSQKQQPKGRSNMNKFQAKTKEEPKSDNKPVTLSRIQQKEQEMLKKQQESQIKQDDELAESLVQFDSDPDQEDTKKLVDPVVVHQPMQYSQNTQENIKQQIVQREIHKEVQQSRLQNNSQYKKKLGQNESSYQQDFDIEIDKFAIIGNNHNQYYEPGQRLVDDYSLPSLQKQNNKIQFDQNRAQEFKTLNQTTKYQEDEIQIIEQQNKYQIVENQQQIIQDIERSSDEEVISDQLLQQQQKEEEVRKELKQQNDKVQMGEHLEQEEGMQQMGSTEQIKQHEEEQVSQIEQKQQQSQDQPKQTCPYPKPLIQIDMPHGKKHFLLNPPPKGGMIQCTIKRDRSGISRIYPKYHMHISNGFLYLMSAKKRACNNTSNYIISLAREDMQKDCNFIGKVRSNFMGTEFVLYDHGQNPEKTKDPNNCRQQLGIVQYESNILGSKGPRKMVLLPKVDEREQMYIFKPTNTKDGILKDYQNGAKDHIETYVNRPPQWNSKHKAFVLNFYQRVDKPSVKNFQLIIDGKEDNILLQFGRVGEDLFNIDFQYPITPLQAFQIALTSFDYKIACE